MTRLGTAFIDVHPDFSNFDRLVSRKLAGSFRDTGEQSGRDFAKGFESNASGLLRPLDRELDDFSANLRTKIRTPRITAPKIAAPKIPTPRVPTPSVPDLPALDLSQTGRLDIQTAGAEADVARLKAHVTELAAQTPTVEVKVAMAKAIADLDRAEAKVRDLDGKRAEIKVDVDRGLPGVFASITAGAQGLFAAIGGGGGGGAGGAVTRLSAGFVSFGGAIGPVAAVIGALAVTIGVSLVGALAALASSLALAAAGAGALGAALVGVLGVSGALAIAVGSRLTKVFDALKASDLARDQASQNALAGSQAAAAGAAAQEAATRVLANAQRGQGEAAQRLKDATSSAYREMADAAEAASDAVRGVTTAQDSLASAKLSIRENELELKKFRGELGATGQAFGDVFNKFTDVAVDTSGLRKAITDAAKSSGASVSEEDEVKLERLILNVRDAKNREKDAIDGVSDAQRTAARAQQTDNEFKRKGIAASQGYASALAGVETASLALADAQRQVKVAQEGKGFSAAQAKALDLTNKLTEKERELLKAIQTVRTELKGAFRGATDAVFGGMITALGRVPALVNPLRASFTRLGESWGKTLDVFSADLIKPGTVNSLRAFTDGAARLTGPITDGLLSLFHIFLNIGRAALPFLVSGTKKVADQLADWAKGTSDTKKLSASIGGLVDHLRVWLKLSAAIGDVFLAFLGVSAEQGKGLAESLTAVAQRTADWLRSAEGQEKVRRFFADVIPFAKDFVKFMAQLIGFTTRFGAVSARVLSRVVNTLGGASSAADGLVFTFTTLAALKFARGLVGGIQSAVTGFRAVRRAAILMHASFVTGNAITRTAGKVQAVFAAVLNSTALAAARQRVALIASRVAALAMAGAARVWMAAQIALNIVLLANPLGLLVAAIAAVVLAIGLLILKSAAVRAALSSAFTFIKDTIVGSAKAVAGAIGSIAGTIGSFASGAFGAAADLGKQIVAGIKSTAGGVVSAVSGAVRSAVNAIGGFFGRMLAAGRQLLRNVGNGISSVAGTVSSAVTGAIRSALHAIGGLLERVRDAGRSIGRGIVAGIRAGLGALGGLGKTIVNSVIDILNRAIRAINSATPGKIKLPGPLPDIPAIPDIPTIQRLSRGGPIRGTGDRDDRMVFATPGEFMTRKLIVKRIGPTVFADINAGRLDPRVGYQDGDRPVLRAVPVQARHLAAGGLVGARAGSESQTTVHASFPITVPGGGPPDPVALGVMSSRVIEDRFGGDVRQD